MALGLFNQVIDLVSPSLRVIESVDHLLERERELWIDRSEFSVAGDDLGFDTAANVGGGGRGVYVEPRHVRREISRDRMALIVGCEEIEELCKL